MLKEISSKLLRNTKLIFCLGALTLSLVNSAEAAGPTNSTRILSFPSDRIYGKIYVITPNWVGTHIGHSVTNEVFEARGDVIVPSNKKLAMTGNAALEGHMDVFKKLPPDALAKLDLGRLQVTGQDLANISHMTALQMIDLDQTDVDDTGLKYLSPLKNLEFLSMSRILLTGKTFNALVPLTKLGRLHLAHCDLQPNALSVLAKMRGIRYLHIGCTKSTDTTIDYLKPLTGLLDISIDDNKEITDRGVAKLKQFKNLVFINLTGTRVTEAGVLGLKGLPLTSLRLQNTAITKQSLDKLKQAFPACNFQLASEFEKDNVFAPLH